MKCRRFFNFRVLLAVAVAAFIAARIYYRVTDDFRIANITYEMPYQSKWEVPPVSAEKKEQLREILSQKFTYIGKGAQSYAFGSEDGQYVIKFVKYKHLRPSFWVDYLPGVGLLKNYKERVQARKDHKLTGVFNGYHLAYDVHQKESGLIYVQLTTGNRLNQIVTLIDKIGLERQVDLSTVNFILQEKVDTSRTAIFSALSNGDVEKAKRYIHNLLDLYLSEYAKGIYDHDHGVLHNTGFVGERPVHLDVGKLYRDDNIRQLEFQQKDLALVIGKISARIHDRFPDFHSELSESMSRYVKEAFDQPAEHLLESCYRR